VEITVDRDVVRVSGHRGPTCCAAGARYHRMEIASGGFARSFRIRVPFVAQKVQARAENGLLIITLPKDRLLQARTIIVESV
jgi:HSP20 family molecular chaperone IbpA